MDQPCGPGQVRIGVSIAVPEPWASALTAARRDFGDPRADTVPPHVTIVGPTVVDVADLPGIGADLAAVAAAAPAFRLRLAGAGSFRPTSPVVFIEVVAGAGECARLAAAARTGPLAAAPKFEYYPHVTVAHEVPEESLDRAHTTMADFTAEFVVTELWLYEDDGVWQPRRSFALEGA